MTAPTQRAAHGPGEWADAGGARHDRDFAESAWSWLGREDSTLLPFAPLLDLVAEYAGTRERVESGSTV